VATDSLRNHACGPCWVHVVWFGRPMQVHPQHAGNTRPSLLVCCCSQVTSEHAYGVLLCFGASMIALSTVLSHQHPPHHMFAAGLVAYRSWVSTLRMFATPSAPTLVVSDYGEEALHKSLVGGRGSSTLCFDHDLKSC
jgi:hypothetical protein